ncbi:MAG TPA: YqaA family protein [Afifellaceae bacterium]|nr:YqaA family protein [Afifellaceae bacterium]
MLRALYDWTMNLAASRHAAGALAVISFVESSVFPVPPDALLVPMVLAERAKAWWYAFLCTGTSVLGGLAGYAIGLFLYEAVAEPLLDFYGYTNKFGQFAETYNEWGAWAVLIAGITPFPFKVITIASGATKLSLPVFIIASLIARAIRFFAVAGLLYVFGPPIRAFIEKRLGLVFTVALGLLLGGFIVVKYAL